MTIDLKTPAYHHSIGLVKWSSWPTAGFFQDAQCHFMIKTKPELHKNVYLHNNIFMNHWFSYIVIAIYITRKIELLKNWTKTENGISILLLLILKNKNN